MLECLSQQASFAITVTRFAQMARYLVLNDIPERTSLDDIGLGMASISVCPRLILRIYVFTGLLSKILNSSSN